MNCFCACQAYSKRRSKLIFVNFFKYENHYFIPLVQYFPPFHCPRPGTGEKWGNFLLREMIKLIWLFGKKASGQKKCKMEKPKIFGVVVKGPWYLYQLLRLSCNYLR